MPKRMMREGTYSCFLDNSPKDCVHSFLVTGLPMMFDYSSNFALGCFQFNTQPFEKRDSTPFIIFCLLDDDLPNSISNIKINI